MGPIYQKVAVATSSFSERYQKKKRDRAMMFSIIMKFLLLIFTSLSIYIFVVTYYWHCNHQVEQPLTAMKFPTMNHRYVISYQQLHRKVSIPSPIGDMDDAMTQDVAPGETGGEC